MALLASIVLLMLLPGAYFLHVSGGNYRDTNLCKDEDYHKRTLKLLREQVVADSFVDVSGYTGKQSKAIIPNSFEASDVVLRSDGLVMYVVSDNSFQIAALCTSMAMHSSNCVDQLYAWPDESTNKLESQFEGIAYNPLRDTYFVVQEAIQSVDDKKKFNPNVFEIRFTTTDSFPVIEILESCVVHWDFDSDNKGFEGLEYIAHQRTKQSYLVGLCEGNSCAGKVSRGGRASNPTGNGRLVVLEKKEKTSKKPCGWEPVGTINLPTSVEFNDYSAVSVYRQGSSTLPTYIAVTSQENSQVWIGLIEEIDDAPYFRVSSLNKNTVYDLPRATEDADQCSIKYCNIEGVAWRGINQLILVSDKSKSDQESACVDKDQSVHSFVLPEYLTD